MKNIKENIKKCYIENKVLILNTALLIYFMIFILCSATLITSQVNILSKITTNYSYLTTIKNVLLYLLGLCFPLIMYVLVFNSKIDISFKFKKVYLKNLLISILLGFFLQPIGMGISGISSLIANGNTASEAMSNFDTNCNILLVSFFMAIMPAVFEELIFRNVFFKNFNKKYSVTISCIISGLFFGIFHMNFQQFVYAFILGIIFAYIFNKTKNILDTMVIHFVIDFTQIITSLILMKNISGDIYEEEMEYTIPQKFGIAFALLIFILFFVPICRSLYKRYKNVNENDTNNEIENEINNEIK